jgi:hypothetical protein
MTCCWLLCWLCTKPGVPLDICFRPFVASIPFPIQEEATAASTTTTRRVPGRGGRWPKAQSWLALGVEKRVREARGGNEHDSRVLVLTSTHKCLESQTGSVAPATNGDVADLVSSSFEEEMVTTIRTWRC